MDTPVPAFGEDIRKEFMLREGGTYMNHGSYGAMPRCVHEKQIQYLEELETCPDEWFRTSMFKYVKAAGQKGSEFIGTDPEDTYLLQNTTKGMNTVLKSFPLKPGDSYMISYLTYPAVKNTSRHTTKRTEGTTTKYLEIQFPIKSEDEMVNKFEEFLVQNPDIKLASIDHITSPTAILMPVKRLTEVCHRHDVIVAIDGAHAPGLIDLNLQDIDADFYCGNFHKWVFSPRACAFLWVNPRRPKPWLTPLITSKYDGQGLAKEFTFEGNFHKWVYSPRSCAFLWLNPKRKHDWLAPLVTSCFHGEGLAKEFKYEGTKDDTPFICIMHGIDYYNRLGGREQILAYTTKLQREGMAYLEERWGTKRLDVPDSFVSPNQQMIVLPYIPHYTDNPEDHNNLLLELIDRFRVYTMPQNVHGTLVCRVMTQVYNTMDDFRKLADAILTMSREKK